MGYTVKLTIDILVMLFPFYWPFLKRRTNLFVFNNRIKMQTRLHKELLFFKKLKESNQELCIFFLSSLFYISIAIGLLLLSHATLANISSEKVIPLLDWLFGCGIYVFSTYRFGQLRRLKHYDRTIEKINQVIKNLEEK
jgi:hypothetical protein